MIGGMLPMRKLLILFCFIFVIFLGAHAKAAVFRPDVRVLLSLEKSKELTVTPVGKFSLKEAPDFKVGNEPIKFSVVGGRISLKAGEKQISAPSFTLLSENYNKTEDYIWLKNSEHGTCTYLGNMYFEARQGAILAINTLPVEQYLYGVVPHEMSNSFPVEALKAQAVCARGFALARATKNSSKAYDLLDTSKDQVYKGYASKNTRAIAAVEQTRGQVLTYNGDIIEAFYSASNGGQTERSGNIWENDLPYYSHADDPFDLLNTSSLEEKTFIPEEYTEETRALMEPNVLFSLEQAAYKAAASEVNLLKTVAVEPKTPLYDLPSRSYTEADVTLLVSGLRGEQSLEGQLTVTLELEKLQYGSFENSLGKLGAKKTRLRLFGAERGVRMYKGSRFSGWYLTQRRYGHGVGLSQRGAQERASRAQAYPEILSFYYPDTTLVSAGSFESAPKLSSEEYKVRKWGISGVEAGTNAAELLKKLVSKADLSVVNSKGRQLQGDVCTGAYVRSTYNSGTEFFDLPIIIFGDVNCDGKINKDDIAALQSHLLKAALLGGPSLKAADLDHNGVVDMWDLHLLIKYINNDAKITQVG